MEATRRQRDRPGDGLIGQIIREHGDEINDFDLAGLADGVFTGGLETSASMLALGTAVLLDHPDDYRAVAADPAVVDRTVEELLRYLSVVQVAFPRFPKHDVEVAGQHGLEGGRGDLPARRRQPRRPHRRGAGAVRPGAGPPRTSPSATASTAASARSWPGWSCGPRSPRWPGGSRTWPRRDRAARLPADVDRLRRRVAPGAAARARRRCAEPVRGGSEPSRSRVRRPAPRRTGPRPAEPSGPRRAASAPRPRSPAATR